MPCALCLREPRTCKWLRQPADQGRTAHVLCVKVVPNAFNSRKNPSEVVLKDVEWLRDNTSKVKKFVCVLCKRKAGLAVVCGFGNCLQAAHMMCVMEHKVHDRWVVDESSETYTLYCPNHARKASAPACAAAQACAHTDPDGSFDDDTDDDQTPKPSPAARNGPTATFRQCAAAAAAAADAADGPPLLSKRPPPPRLGPVLQHKILSVKPEPL